MCKGPEAEKGDFERPLKGVKESMCPEGECTWTRQGSAGHWGFCSGSRGWQEPPKGREQGFMDQAVNSPSSREQLQ